MKATVESTENVVDVADSDGLFGGAQARIWKGVTENGVEFQMLVVRVAVDRDSDCAQFERELQEKHAPTVWPAAFGGGLIL